MGGVFGGDSSVQWEVISDNPRNLDNNRVGDPDKPNKFRQFGKEDTAAGAYFFVSIEVPRDPGDKTDLQAGLAAAAAALQNEPAGSQRRVWFRLKIEDRQGAGENVDQISIDWVGIPAGIPTGQNGGGPF